MQQREIQLYSAVALPYDEVRSLLRSGEVRVLRSPRVLVPDLSATEDGVLDLEVAGLHLLESVRFTCRELRDVPGRLPLARLRLRWEPEQHRERYPAVTAELEIEPIDDDRTMLSLLATYVPPLGRVGVVVDRLALHRVTERALRRFFSAVVRQIRLAGVRPAPPLGGSDG